MSEKGKFERKRKQDQVPQNFSFKRQGEEVSGAIKKKRVDPIAEVPLVAISKEKNTSEEPVNMSRGRKMVALAKFKRPNISTQNRSKRFSERDSIISTVTEKRKEFSPKQRNVPKLAVREIDRSLLVKTRSEPIGSGTFGNCFLAEYRGITAVVKVIKRRNDTGTKRK